LKEAM